MTLIMVEVFLVRHAESLWNCATDEERKRDKTLRDAELSVQGRAQLKTLCETLPAGARKASVILCSPLRRAVQTAMAISLETKIPIKIDSRLREIRRDVSDSGSSKKDLAKCFPSLDFEHLVENWWLTSAAPGCKCEPLYECTSCADARKRQLVTLISDSATNTIIVSHSDLFLAALGWDAKNAEVKAVTVL